MAITSWILQSFNRKSGDSPWQLLLPNPKSTDSWTKRQIFNALTQTHGILQSTPWHPWGSKRIDLEVVEKVWKSFELSGGHSSTSNFTWNLAETEWKLGFSYICWNLKELELDPALQMLIACWIQLFRCSLPCAWFRSCYLGSHPLSGSVRNNEAANTQKAWIVAGKEG